MAKISAKEQRALLFLGIFVGIPVLVFQKITDAGAWPFVLGALIVGGVSYVFIKKSQHAARIAYLRKKYSNESTVQAILKGSIWDGMSEDQVVDSIGHPAAVDQKYLKTKTREVWKYYPQGKNRYGLRITLDDGQVNGWDSKG